MHRLDPSCLLLLGLDLVAAREIEQRVGAVAQHRDETLAGRAVFGNDVVGIGTRQRRDHLAVVAARGAPSRLGRLDHGDVDSGFAQVQRRR